MTLHPHPVCTTTLQRLRRHQALSLRRPQGWLRSAAQMVPV